MKSILNHLLNGESAHPEQVTQVITNLMAGELDPVAAGSFLTLQMRNGIDGPQLRAALEAMMSFASRIKLKDASAIDNCGTGGDGGATFNVSTTACFVIAGAGHTVAKHGNRAVSSSCGSADLLEDLGVNLRLEPDQVKRCIDEVGIGFMFAPTFHSAVRHAVPIRRSLRVRTIFNMLGPLANPAGVNHQLIGVFSEELTDLFGQVLADLGRTAFVVHGQDGADEVSLTTPTRVTEVRDGGIRTDTFDPRDYGFQLADPAAFAGGGLAENRAIFTQVLQHGAAGPHLELVVLNAGFAMFTSGNYSDLNEAFQSARQAIDNGGAWRSFEALRDWSSSQS